MKVEVPPLYCGQKLRLFTLGFDYNLNNFYICISSLATLLSN